MVLAILLGGAAVVLVWSLLRAGPGGSAEDARLSLLEGADAADRDPGPGPGAGGPAGRAPAPRGRRPGARPVAIAGVAVAQPCHEEIRTLETDLQAARLALAYYLPPGRAWEDAKDSGPNLTAQQAIEPVVGRWLDDKGAPRGGQSIDCRQDVCFVKVRQAWPPTSWITRDATAASQTALEARAREISASTARRGSATC